MSINVEKWNSLISCGMTEGALSAIANIGDMESVENALEAGLSKMGAREHLVAAAELADAESFSGSLPRRAEDVLMKWAADYSADDLSHALISLITATKPRPRACSVLVRAGADPYREVQTYNKGRKPKSSALEHALAFQTVDALGNLAGLLGSSPITDPSQLPRLLSYTNTSLSLAQPCNALEYAIANHNRCAAAWMIDRIDRGSPARELLFDLGDIALQLLEMDGSGKSLTKNITFSNRNLAKAYAFIATGAEFRSPEIWEKVLNKGGHYQKNQNYLSYSIVAHKCGIGNNGLAADHFHLCLAIFIDNGCLKIDAQDHTGHTMLMNAARYGSDDVVDLLLQRGACVTPTAIIEGCKTPVDALHYAKKSKNPDMVCKILAATAKQSITRTIELDKVRRSTIAQGTS
jgi:hypothetical protein